MSTKEQFKDAPGIRQGSRNIVPQNQLAVNIRMFATGMAFILVLPALGGVLVALTLGSSALLLVASLIWIIFGIAHCVLYSWTLKANIANETEGETILTPRTTGQMLAVEPPAARLREDAQRDTMALPLSVSHS